MSGWEFSSDDDDNGEEYNHHTSSDNYGAIDLRGVDPATRTAILELLKADGGVAPKKLCLVTGA